VKEQHIQNLLFSWLVDKKHLFITPNVRLFGRYESDLISVSRSHFIYEYEIKVSRDDFFAEFRRKELKHARLSKPVNFKKRIPNYFNFVFPADLYANWDDDPVPEYAGVVVVDGDGRAKQVQAARCLHRVRADQREIDYLGRGLMFRYWTARAYMMMNHGN
jgi:hypothetical protein